MPSREDIHYFGAGPAPLPTEVLEDAAKVLLNYNDSGLGITEISHRSAEAKDILDRTKNALRKLLDIPDVDGADGYEVLFMQGGGSGQFSASATYMTSAYFGRLAAARDTDAADQSIARSVLERSFHLDYLVTGSWSLKASQEAARLIHNTRHLNNVVNIATDARESSPDGKSFGSIPPESAWRLTDKASCGMIYYCDNETVDGVEFPFFPASLEGRSEQLVCDMSSNFLSRCVDVRKYAAIFAGAQKNVGTTGITIAIVKRSLLPPYTQPLKPALANEIGLPNSPLVLDWATIAKNDSLYNTLPIFDAWVAGQVMQRLLTMSTGSGARLATQESEAGHKASLIYGVLYKYPSVYHVVPDRSCRSRMNICFRVGQGEARTELEKTFLAGATSQNMLGCKGHRSVGGCRVSNYNAVTVQSVEKMAAYLEQFASAQR